MSEIVRKEESRNISTTTGYQEKLEQGQIDQIKNCVSFQGTARDLTNEEIRKIWYIIQTRKLDPDAKQIYFICDNKNKIQVFNSIDGLRLTAQRSGQYEGQEGPFFCGDDGVWKDVWLSNNPPKAARVEVWRKGFRSPVRGIALYKEYAKQFGPWKQYPTIMLAKVAESLALRKAFPEELSGVYGEEENWMDQRDEKDEEKKNAIIIEAEAREIKSDIKAIAPQKTVNEIDSIKKNIFEEYKKIKSIDDDRIDALNEVFEEEMEEVKRFASTRIIKDKTFDILSFFNKYITELSAIKERDDFMLRIDEIVNIKGPNE